ncbi:MAG TPA: OsmC family protein [Rhodocyclaceae bacterium]|nr:OsmC family protein [Rhodocyclaceae bacterium]
MNAEQLRQLQAPIKALYKEDPAAAVRTFRAEGTLLPDRPACRIETRFASFDAGLHPAAGGDGSEACSGDMLLESLVACAGVTFNVVATAMGIPFRSARVVVEGDGDFRGTLGIARDVPVGITDIRLRFEVDSPASDEQLAVLMRQTERYCVIFQTLRTPPRLAASLQRTGG